MCRKLIHLISFVLLLGLAVSVASGLEVKINFQPRYVTGTTALVPIPEGYLADYGEVFGDRGNGYNYGWDANIVGSARDRNMHSQQRYDTLIEMGTATWEIELPDGSYDIFLACGDPQYTDRISTQDVEGVILVDPDGKDKYDQYEFRVVVSDGRLTIRPAPGSLKCPVEFVHISRVGIFKAYGPNPENGATHPDTNVTLSWSPGDAAASHNVYLGDNFNDVNSGTGDTFRGNQTGTSFIAGTTEYVYPNGLVPGTTYYWRIDEVNELHPNKLWKGDVWSFKIPGLTAYDSDPPEGATFVDVDVNLGWSAGLNASLHHLYLGTDKETVKNATTSSPEYKGPDPNTSFSPDILDKEKTYYWRVDEYDGVTTHKGEVWSFTTIPVIQITDPNLLCWWKFDAEEDSDTHAIDNSGHDHHGIINGASLALSGQVGEALNFGGDGDYVVDEDAEEYLNGLNTITVCMWIKSNEKDSERGFINCADPNGKDEVVSMRYDAVGGSWGGVNVVKMGVRSSPPVPSYKQQLESSGNVQTTNWQHVAMTWRTGEVIRFYVNGILNIPTGTTDPCNLGGTVSDCTKLIIGKGGQDLGGVTNGWNGLIDDVRIYNKVLTESEIKKVMRGEPNLAWNPIPANGSTPDLHRALPLGWSPGNLAAQHDVYFGTNKDAVSNASISDTTGIYRGRRTAISYTPLEGVKWGTGPYYWRIDEYNNDGTISKGRLWQFTVTDFILVDDFESYDSNCLRVYYNWRDGLSFDANPSCNVASYAGNSTGAAIGHDIWSTGSPHYQGDIIEKTIVHEGGQSMPFYYNNNKQDFLKYSEAKMALNYPRNWTEEGVKALTLWFRGYAAGFKEGPSGTYMMSASGADIGGTSDQFRYVYKQLSGAGSIEAQVLSIQNTHEWAKAGVMIRRALDTGTTYAAVFITPSFGCAFQGRLTIGSEHSSDTKDAVATPEQKAITAPYWIKIERGGANNYNFYGYYSSDGVNWQAMAWNPQYIPMPGNVYIGLALTSHNSNAICKAQFSNVKTTGTVTSPTWTNAVIGTATMLSNDAETMYVAVANKTGTPAVVYYSDPSAAQIDTWAQWNIDLKDFTNQGVNLADVESIAIGFGNRNNPQAGGSGLVYFDDVRLYRSRCVPEKLTLSQADLNSDCMVDFGDIEIMAGDWLTNGPDTDLNVDSTVDFKDYAVLAVQWLEEKTWP